MKTGMLFLAPRNRLLRRAALALAIALSAVSAANASQSERFTIRDAKACGVFNIGQSQGELSRPTDPDLDKEVVRLDYTLPAGTMVGVWAKEFPDTPEAVTVLPLRAEIELLHLNQPARALRHFDTYLTKRPGGALEAEALWGKARALKTLQRAKDEQKTLELLLKKYPVGLFSPQARKRLKELE